MNFAMNLITSTLVFICFGNWYELYSSPDVSPPTIIFTVVIQCILCLCLTYYQEGE